MAVLTSIIGEAGREIATSSSKREANRITDAAIVLIRRINPLDV